ncbi:hypothetical protein SteCoe_24557 [Stentor coeruleus]|uniref:Transmembrane protein n=1 Tax=Stentor coeruleus TaxID=5963 RepID=A0A1R2BHJ9_9CILI|nr:hypothetical protein SteCoe_24557 [Stentor coeruleus]
MVRSDYFEKGYEEDEQKKKRMKTIECSCCMNILVFFYICASSFMCYALDTTFYQIWTNGDSEFKFKGSINGPSEDVNVIFFSNSSTKLDFNSTKNEPYFEVHCSKNQTFLECYDNCIGECEFFKEWSYSWKIFQLGFYPTLGLYFFAILFYKLGWRTGYECFPIIIGIITIIPPLNFIVFTITWVLKINIRPEKSYHNVFNSNYSPVTADTGFIPFIIAFITMPICIAVFFLQSKKMLIAFKKANLRRKIQLSEQQSSDIGVIIQSDSTFKLRREPDQFAYSNEIRSLETNLIDQPSSALNFNTQPPFYITSQPKEVLEEKELKKPEDFMNPPEIPPDYYHDDFMNNDRINKSVSQSFDDDNEHKN